MRTKASILTFVAVLALMAPLAVADIQDPTVEIKWSQPPFRPFANPELIYGWDQISMAPMPIVADDFRCNDPRMITDVHWWGSYPDMPTGNPLHPDAFLFTFWTDVPAGADPLVPWSHPGEPLKRVQCREYLVEHSGWDIDVGLYKQTGQTQIMDECFQYYQKLKPEDYFEQEPGKIYWISIQAIYDDPANEARWGWKTRPRYFNDDAVSGYDDGSGNIWWEEILRFEESWDMAYELSVPEPATMLLLAAGSGIALLRRGRRRAV